ncbi:hypothetical protein CUMW_250130 [Citrus unshiu]|uniref:Uncharacterized protein n=1 Tax=Citrus unshiu TaxID=55188 RepID=A0A2H5QPQ6_CITUN|nr:hypothetical protein CUMW_250130 [Citrus unshiu]
MSTPMVNPPKGDFAGAMVIDHSDTVTVLVLHPLGPYLSWLKVDGKIILLGAIKDPLEVFNPKIIKICVVLC